MEVHYLILFLLAEHCEYQEILFNEFLHIEDQHAQILLPNLYLFFHSWLYKFYLLQLNDWFWLHAH